MKSGYWSIFLKKNGIFELSPISGIRGSIGSYRPFHNDSLIIHEWALKSERFERISSMEDIKKVLFWFSLILIM